MQNLPKITVAIVAMLMFVACSTEALKNDVTTTNPCETNQLPIKTLETEYGCTNTKYQMHINLKDTFTIINSAASFSSLVTGSCLPAIDFNAYDLLIGKKPLLTDNQSIGYTATYNCNTNKLEVKVTFKQTAAGTAPNITYHLLIPKHLGITAQNLQMTYQIQ
jgi:hypothetical protein